MPRPVTPRRIVHGLRPAVFEPAGTTAAARQRVPLTLDALEALRLADLEGLYHDEAARRMGVSRATFSRVLAGARGVVADALVNGKTVEIGGGEVARQPAGPWPCPIHEAGARRGRSCRCGRGSTIGVSR